MQHTRAWPLCCAAVIALLGVLIAANWAPDIPLEVLQHKWAQPPSRFVSVRGTSIHVREEGPLDGVPILLIHGTSADLHTWRGWTDILLRHGYRVLSLDLPGFGLTGPYAEGANANEDASRVYSVARYAETVGAVLDALGYSGRSVFVCGNSLGGQVAAEFALHDPLRVAGLILVDAAGTAVPWTRIPIAFRLAQYPFLAPLVERVLPRAAVERSVRSVYGDPSRVTAATVDRYVEMARRHGNRRVLFSRMLARAKEPLLEGRLGRITAPTLILWGRLDELIPVAAAHVFVAGIPGSQLVVLEGLGHVPHEEDPAASLAPVLDFLGAVRARAGEPGAE
jgi:pimeloyl-ACP methyl ester carboxylesterase